MSMGLFTHPIRIGVIGLGRAFTLMLPTFVQDARVRLVAALDPRPEARAQFERDFAGRAHADLQDFLRQPDIDVVYIASPHQFHKEQAIAVARAGKPMLIEKPLALTLADCQAIVAAARQAGVGVVVGHCHSFDTPYLKAAELIASGQYGRPRLITAFNYTDFMYRPRRPEELDTAQGGGVVFSQGAHQFDVIRLLAGGRVTRVQAVTHRWDPRRPTEGAYSALLWFDNGCTATATYSGYGHFDSDRLNGGFGEMGHRKAHGWHGQSRALLRTMDAGEEARFKAARGYGGDRYQYVQQRPEAFQHFGEFLVSLDGADLRPLPGGVEIHGDEAVHTLALAPPAIPRAEVIDELQALVESGGRPPLHDARWATETMRVCLAVLESARQGAAIELEALP